MKPHEEKGWKVYQSGKANHGVSRPDGSIVATRIATHDEAMLLSAAGAMARALVELLARIEREGPADVVDPLYDAGREALQKAGVL